MGRLKDFVAEYNAKHGPVRQISLAEDIGVSYSRMSLIINGLEPRDEEKSAIVNTLKRRTGRTNLTVADFWPGNA